MCISDRLINLTKDHAERVEQLVAQCEKDCDDDAESIITGERYGVIANIIDECLTKAPAKMSTSEKIDRVAVSYTHLDVYKRQVLLFAGGAGRFERCGHGGSLQSVWTTVAQWRCV